MCRTVVASQMYLHQQFCIGQSLCRQKEKNDSDREFKHVQTIHMFKL